MLKNKLLIIITLSLAVIFFIFLSTTASGQKNNQDLDNDQVLYYFWGFCPVCSKPEEHVWLFEGYPVEVVIYEVFHDPEGRQIYDQFRESLAIEVYGFPTLVYQDQYWLGFADSVQKDILEAIEASAEGITAAGPQSKLSIPVWGEIDLLASPILLTTAIIATLDGFNPCSLFVLTFLLAIIVHSASRKRIFLIGITFLIVTAAVYGFFILGILNIMIFASSLFWIRNIVAAVVIILGLVAIKDFLFFKSGISFSIPDSYKNKYYQQVRKIFYTKSIFPTIIATTVMALGISLVELPCTAGFPFIWSSIVAGLELSMAQFALLFLVYLLLYLAIELIIFLIALIRMRSIKFTEERGRFLKLVAGSLMLVLGLILLIRPDYMENVLGLVIAFGSSALLVVSIYLIRTFVSNISS